MYIYVFDLTQIALALRVWQSRDAGGEAADRSAKHLFAYSILYLTLIFAALLAEGVFDLQQGF